MIKHWLRIGFISTMLASCAWLSPTMQPPKVVLESIQMLPSNGLNQRFNIGLRMTNPNDHPLKVNGISYTLALNGYDLIDGVGNNIPEVAPYSEVTFNVQASTNLMEAIMFVNDFLGGQAQGDLNYRLRANIAVSGLLGKLVIDQAGVVPLAATKTRKESAH
jgi:LEA14-like dessication related protein